MHYSLYGCAAEGLPATFILIYEDFMLALRTTDGAFTGAA
jgi:hypothetical protein